jgi:hypothetical protein
MQGRTERRKSGTSRGGGHDVIEHTFIPLANGTRLAARIWMPRGADKRPVPAVLEYIPYRKRDGTCWRDESTYPVFADAGYAGVRVDIRGNGESDGLFDDEYSPRELADACEVIAWIADQDWCSGAVGMMGISWGGFNALQVAALRPPALKAIISLSATVDRYNDDIHYKNGCHLSANVSWSTVMLCYASRPPDPMLVGDGWKSQWMERLESEPLLIARWLGHQTRDEYWRHGSIGEDYAAIETPTLIIGGWSDGYKNAPPAVAANLTAPAKAINGPWIHKYPHFAWPKPRADFHGEALRWWDRWLKGKRNGAERLPAYRAYITENIRPSAYRAHDAGRWVGEKSWPSRSVKPQTLHLTAHRTLERRAGPPAVVRLSSPQDCGIMGGEYFTLKPDAELPQDQRLDDGGSLVIETTPLEQPMEILGRPKLALQVAIDRPVGNLIARLVDVHPDGTGHRVSFGVLNLAHRHGNDRVVPMTPGEPAAIEIVLDECGHRFLTGHRVRIALSTAYWPLILPPPDAAVATIALGVTATLTLPVRKGGDRIEVPEPENPDPLPKYRETAPARSRRWVERDLSAGLTRYHIDEDFGASEIAAADGLIAHETRREVYAIAPDDPLRAVSDCTWSAERRRGSWQVKTVAWTRLTGDDRHFSIEARIEAYENGNRIYERTWSERIARHGM